MAVKEADLLRRITTVEVNGAEKFVANDQQLKAANVGWTGSNFRALFLNKAEENVGKATIVVHSLEKNSLDVAIMAELGTRVEIHLCQFFALIAKQSKGEAGPLLVNGYANIAYIRGNDGNLWAVYAYWRSACGYWHVYADSVEYPREWHAGDQVLSRDSDSL